MMRCKYAVELVFDEEDGLVRGSAVIGLAVEGEDGAIWIDLKAAPMSGEPLRLTKLPDLSDRLIREASVAYRKERARRER